MKIEKRNEKEFLIKGIFEKDVKNDLIIKKANTVSEDTNEKIAYIYLGKKCGYKLCTLKNIATIIAKYPRNAQIDVSSFVEGDINESIAIRELVYGYEYNLETNIYNAKTKKKDKKTTLSLTNTEDKESLKRAMLFINSTNYVRNYQITPPNILRSTVFAENIEKDFKGTNIKVTVLKKEQIKKLGMGLLLSVNAGSAFDPRVVVLEYKGNPSSKENIGLVGKGIMFDSGGMNIKTGRFMLNMKYDMSGAAIVAGTMKIISELKPKKNIFAVMTLTDNMISPIASQPDSVWTSMNGKTVEINNTDAEGRLVMADGLTYAIRQKKATQLIDIATLTGAMPVALGLTYTGIWSTEDELWNNFIKASKLSGENVWRMPFHEDFAKNIRASKIADLKNTDYSGKAGSSSAGMFLKEFTEKLPYIHIDVAGTAEDKNGVPCGIMVKTLAEYLTNE